MELQKQKHGAARTFRILNRVRQSEVVIVPVESASREVLCGSFPVLDLQNNCRLCLEEPNPSLMLDMSVCYDHEAGLSYYDCYEICTKEDLKKRPSHEPRTLCKRCAVELQWAYDFHKKVALANQQLREIFESSNQDSAEQEKEDDELDEEYLVEEEENDSNEEKKEEENEQECQEENDLEFQKPEDLLTHQSLSRKITCKFCQKVFKNRSSMVKHEIIHLTNRPRFRCSQCHRVYLTKQALRVHVEAKHQQSGATCDTCGKVFGIAKALEIHKRYHSKDFPFACDLCDRKYAQRSHLTVHQNVKHSGARFLCEYADCNKTFTSSSSLRYHEVTHTAMPFECVHCQKSFPARTKLRLHLKSDHNRIVQIDELEEMRKFRVPRSKLVLTKINEKK
ncbi:zinc finger protein OZF [Drosophila bipectinata]|uniref:zinc finger protein OZF n=1 Tax=Drosophila bipectinata TaxID=42026 RepID=UPI001C8A0784|nr:zinc finger protein 689 [Drosophila bipectinata]